MVAVVVCGMAVAQASVADAPVPEPYQYGLASIVGLFSLVLADRIRQRKLSVE